MRGILVARDYVCGCWWLGPGQGFKSGPKGPEKALKAPSPDGQFPKLLELEIILWHLFHLQVSCHEQRRHRLYAMLGSWAIFAEQLFIGLRENVGSSCRGSEDNDV